MWKYAVVYAVLLIALGVAFYAGTQAPISLIPSAFGVLVLICGIVAIREKYRMHAMHAALGMALILLVLGTWMGVFNLTQQIVELTRNHAAEIEQTLMGILSLMFVILCVKSFIDVRRERRKRAKEEAAAPAPKTSKPEETTPEESA